MNIYAILFEPENAAMRSKIQDEYPINIEFAEGQFMVAVDGKTTRQLAEPLGGDKGSYGKLLILPVANYWGWHNQDLWEWLKVNSAS